MNSRPTDRLELWEGGRRIPEEYSPGNFDWWYFDAQLSDGSTLVVVFHIDQDYRKNSFVYRVWAELVRPDGQHVAGAYSTHHDGSIQRDRPDVRIGKSYLRGDLDTYRVVVDIDDIGNLGLDASFRRTCPSRVSPANRENVLHADEVFGWVCIVPRGELTGTLTVDGELTAVQGTVYHDKNWGTASMGSLMHHWLWFRAAVGPYTAVFFSQYPTEAYAIGDKDGLQQLFIASEREVVVNLEGPAAVRLTAPVTSSPDPRNPSSYWVSDATIEAEQNGTRTTLQARTGDLVSSIDLAKQTKYLTLQEIARAAEMENRPWYSRFVATPVTLTLNQEGKTESHSGQGVIEFMDFHLNA